MKKRPWTILFIVVVAVEAWSAYRAPVYNWDLLPYVASVFSLDGLNDSQAHAAAYRVAQNEAPEAVYAELVGKRSVTPQTKTVSIAAECSKIPTISLNSCQGIE